jgi:hypothetical protein
VEPTSNESKPKRPNAWHRCVHDPAEGAGLWRKMSVRPWPSKSARKILRAAGSRSVPRAPPGAIVPKLRLCGGFDSVAETIGESSVLSRRRRRSVPRIQYFGDGKMGYDSRKKSASVPKTVSRVINGCALRISNPSAALAPFKSDTWLSCSDGLLLVSPPHDPSTVSRTLLTSRPSSHTTSLASPQHSESWLHGWPYEAQDPKHSLGWGYLNHSGFGWTPGGGVPGSEAQGSCLVLSSNSVVIVSPPHGVRSQPSLPGATRSGFQSWHSPMLSVWSQGCSLNWKSRLHAISTQSLFLLPQRLCSVLIVTL